MTSEMILVLLILAGAFILLISERLRRDLIALLVLGAVALTGLVTPEQAISGFANPAVVTVWAVFILSGALSITGVAKLISRPLLRIGRGSEIRLIVAVMLTAGAMSAFLNNVGVAALLLPVVMDLARRTGRAPSRLLIPLAYGALLGGMTTLIGTPPNILASGALFAANLEPFSLFDFTPFGLVVMIAGIVYVAFIGRAALPRRDIAQESAAGTELGELYDFSDRMFFLNLPEDSALDGKTLAESRLGALLWLNVIAIQRGGTNILAPRPEDVLRSGDQLVVGGRLDKFETLRSGQHLTLAEMPLAVERLHSNEVDLAEAIIADGSALIGKTLLETEFRKRYGALVMSILRDGEVIRTGADSIPIRVGDALLIQAPHSELDRLTESGEFESSRRLSDEELVETYKLHERLVILKIPADSMLVGQSLSESRLGESFGLAVLGITRNGSTELFPNPFSPLSAGDELLVKGSPDELDILSALQELSVEDQVSPDLKSLESEEVGLSEVVLSPHTTLDGQSLRDLHFREKFGLNVLAVWREGKAHRSDLRNIALKFGDALLLYGSRQRLQVLGSEPDFLVLTEEAQQPLRTQKAPVAGLIMAGVLLSVVLGWVTIPIAALVGAALMVLTGCLKMDEAYRYIEWQAVFLIAGMIPLGIAMQESGLAEFIAGGMVMLVGDYGSLAIVAGIFLLTTLTSQVMPNAAVTVLMVPIALNTAADMSISPYALMMTVAIAASASFLSPVAHPANSLVMGPGGYRFSDFLRAGLPLTLIVFVLVLTVMPIIWPLTP